MATITAKAGQSMSDLVIMAMGTMQGAADFCNLNGVAISDDPVIGNIYNVPVLTKDNSDSAVLAYLASKGVNIGTGGKKSCGRITGITQVALISTSITLKWHGGEGCIGFCHFAISNVDIVPIAWTILLPITGDTYQSSVSLLTPGTNYYIHIRTLCDGDITDRTSPWTTYAFTTPV